MCVRNEPARKDGVAIPLNLTGSVADSNAPSLEFAIRKTFPSSNSDSAFVLDAHLRVPAGITILFGSSGSGKSTVLNAIAGLLKPDSGTIRCGERVVFYSGAGIDTPTRKRNIGYVFQDLALFPHLSAERNISYGLSDLGEDQRRDRISGILQQMKIEKLGSRRPGEISGGERQRVALARALVTNPAALLLDEPLSALDNATKTGIMNDLRNWNMSHRVPILYVTHNREEAFALGERVAAIESGRIVATGSALEVLQTPRHEAVADWVGLENVFDATVIAIHENQGTMSCRIAGTETDLELPLGRVQVGEKAKIGIGAGEILLATQRPEAISARNILSGEVVSLSRHDVTITATVRCGVDFKIHLTLGAEQSLKLVSGVRVWLIVKTYSCHLLHAK